MFLEKYNFIVIEIKKYYFNDDMEIYSDDCYNEDSDKEDYDDSDDSDEENSDEKI